MPRRQTADLGMIHHHPRQRQLRQDPCHVDDRFAKGERTREDMRKITITAQRAGQFDSPGFWRDRSKHQSGCSTGS